MRFINKRIDDKVISKLNNLGWKLFRIFNFDDERKSANYFFKNDNVTLVLFTEKGIIKAMQNDFESYIKF